MCRCQIADNCIVNTLDPASRQNGVATSRLNKRADSNGQLRTMAAPANVDAPLWNVSSAEERRELLNGNEVADSDTRRQSTSDILMQYQVKEDSITSRGIRMFPDTTKLVGREEISLGKKAITTTQAGLLDKLDDKYGSYDGTATLTALAVSASMRADTRFPSVTADIARGIDISVPGKEDGHNDAFRHAYMSAMLTNEYGVGFADAFGTAHEGVPGNSAHKEAMDLYNNEVGRRIAVENPDASSSDMADLIHRAIDDGEAVVINETGKLAYSDEVDVGKTGVPDSYTLDSFASPPAWDPAK